MENKALRIAIFQIRKEAKQEVFTDIERISNAVPIMKFYPELKKRHLNVLP